MLGDLRLGVMFETLEIRSPEEFESNRNTKKPDLKSDERTYVETKWTLASRNSTKRPPAVLPVSLKGMDRFCRVVSSQNRRPLYLIINHARELHVGILGRSCWLSIERHQYAAETDLETQLPRHENQRTASSSGHGSQPLALTNDLLAGAMSVPSRSVGYGDAYTDFWSSAAVTDRRMVLSGWKVGKGPLEWVIGGNDLGGQGHRNSLVSTSGPTTRQAQGKGTVGGRLGHVG
ncbi:hypothetical protein PQX77_003311 [Marasmius sp. AFHP31]|nr:hypothetical protein PQX77_003311 [Marasmius sp. AFHP31]